MSGAVPPPAARPLERTARVPRPVCPGCGRCGRVDPAPAPQRAPLRAGVARCGGGGRASPGGVPSTVVRGAWCQALSLPRPPVLWSGQPGFRNPCVPGAVDTGVWTQHRPRNVRPCGPALLAVGVAGGRPRGGAAFHRCEGRLVSGAVPPPAARPLERAARVPVCVCVRVRALLGRVGRASLPGAFWCASPFPLAALSFCFAWPPPGWGCPPLSRCPCRSSLPWRCALVLFLGLPLPGSSCAPASFVSPAWPLAALWWFLPPPPPFLCLAVFVAPAWCLGVVLCFFFFFFPSPVRPRCLWLSLVSGPGCPGPRRCAFFALLAFRLSALRAFVPLSCFPPGWWLLPVGCCLPPPPFLSRGFRRCRSVLCAVCCVVLCVPGCGAAPRCCTLCSPVLCCSVLCCARWVPLLVAPCPLALPVALGPCALRRCVLRCSPVLCVFCRGAVVRAVVRRSALCCVCPGVLCCAFPVLSALCGAVLRCAGALALCCSCGGCCCWRLVLWCAVVRCWVCWPVVVCWWRVSLSVSLSGRVVCFPAVGVVCCGALLSCVVFCGAVLSRGAVLLCSAVVLRCCWGLLCPPVGCRAVLCCAVSWLCCFLPGGGGCVLWRSSPRAVRPLFSPLCALWCLVVLAVVLCFPVSFAVALCCRVVLCCRALLSFCGAVCVCFALLRPVVRRQCRLRCCWCLVLWRVPVRCAVSLGVLRCGGAALVCRGVLLCCALSCGVLRPVPCPAVPCRLAGFVSCVGVVVPT